MALYKNFDGTLKTEFTLGKSPIRAGLRTNSGVLEFQDNGEAWIPVLQPNNAESSTTAGQLLFADSSGGYLHSEISELFWDDTDKRFGIKIASPVTNLDVREDRDDSIIRVMAHSNTGAHAGVIDLGSTRGSQASPTATVDGDILGVCGFRGYTGLGTAFPRGAEIKASADGNWTALIPSNQGTFLTFSTTENSTATLSEKMRLTGEGHLGIQISKPQYPLDVLTTARIYDSTVDSTVYLITENDNHSIGWGINGSETNDFAGMYDFSLASWVFGVASTTGFVGLNGVTDPDMKFQLNSTQGMLDFTDSLWVASNIAQPSLAQINGSYPQCGAGFFRDNGNIHFYFKPATGGTFQDWHVFANDGSYWNKGGRRKKRTTVNAATYTLLTTDHIICIDYSSTGSCTITIPTALLATEQEFVFMDSGGNSATTGRNITIVSEGSETINGDSSYIINVDYAAVTIFSNGTNWLAYK